MTSPPARPRRRPLRWPWGRVAVAGRSMEPTLRPGDWLVVRWGAFVRPGRLVVVRLPGGPLSVKRAFRRVPEGWWLERDNPAEGVDSWQVGAVPDGDVLGVVLFRYWPLRSAPRLRRRS
jgi:SOS-response transcriptional repressor LexA